MEIGVGLDFGRPTLFDTRLTHICGWNGVYTGWKDMWIIVKRP